MDSGFKKEISLFGGLTLPLSLIPVYKVPSAPLVVQCLISIALVLLRDLNQLTSLVVFIGLMVNTFIEDPQTSIIGLAVPAVGILFYLYFDRKNKAAIKA